MSAPEFCFVEPRWAMNAVALHIGYETNGMRTLISADGTRRVVSAGDPLPTDYVPALVVDEQLAREVVRALTNHFGGVGDTRALRRDYNAERVRVDKLTDAVIALARSASTT